MLLTVSGLVMLMSGLGHIAVFFLFENIAVTMLIFGAIYTACGMLQLGKLRMGALITVISVTIGVSLGVYGSVVLGRDPAPFALVFLAIEAFAVGCSVTYLIRTKASH
jgi:hypothetical protein